MRKEERADVPYAPFAIKAALDEIIVSECRLNPLSGIRTTLFPCILVPKSYTSGYPSLPTICRIGQAVRSDS